MSKVQYTIGTNKLLPQLASVREYVHVNRPLICQQLNMLQYAANQIIVAQEFLKPHVAAERLQ